MSRSPVRDEDPIERIRRISIENSKHKDPSRISDLMYDKIRQATATDTQMQEIIKATKTGWKEKREELKCYWTSREEIVEEDRVLYKGSAVIIPKELRKEFIQRIHKSHSGYDAMCRRIKDSIYWFGIKNDLKNLAETCDACQAYRNKQRVEPLCGKPTPTRPWEVIHQDLCVWDNIHYLVTVDGYSDYLEIDKLGKNTTTANIIQKTQAHFARYGRPSEMHTDSDPRYLADEFQKFLKSWLVRHVTSSPHNHQSNGKSESAVKIAKKLIKKTAHLHENLDQALLEWRMTPQTDGRSPAEKLFGRKLASLVPSRAESLTPADTEAIQKEISRRRETQKKYYDRKARPLTPLRPGQPVRIQPTDFNHIWKSGTCEKQVSPRSYLIKAQNGVSLIRNRRFLVAVPRKDSADPLDTHPSDKTKQVDSGTKPRENSTIEKKTTSPKIRTKRYQTRAQEKWATDAQSPKRRTTAQKRQMTTSNNVSNEVKRSRTTDKERTIEKNPTMNQSSTMEVDTSLLYNNINPTKVFTRPKDNHPSAACATPSNRHVKIARTRSGRPIISPARLIL